MRSEGFAIACAALSLLAGCATAGVPKSEGGSVRLNEGAYEASLPPDIRKILTAGGLDAKDPSAPTRDTEVAELAGGSVGKAVEKAPKPEEATKLLALASSGDGQGGSDSRPSVQSFTFVYPQIGAEAPAGPERDSVAVAAAEREKPRPRHAETEATPSSPPARPATSGSMIQKPRRF